MQSSPSFSPPPPPPAPPVVGLKEDESLVEFEVGPVVQATKYAVGDAVVPLFVAGQNLDVDNGADPACSGTFIADGLLLTAAHCLGANSAFWLGNAIGNPLLNVLVPSTRTRRACYVVGQSCAGPSLGTENDIGTLVVKTLEKPHVLALTSFVAWKQPPMILLGYQGKRAPIVGRAVCRAWLANGVGQGDLQVELGDSGGSLVALLDNPARTPVVLGVVSGRIGNRMFFAPTPGAQKVPIPEEFSGDNPGVEEIADSARFAPIAECAQGQYP
jgi:hypothetical protein